MNKKKRISLPIQKEAIKAIKSWTQNFQFPLVFSAMIVSLIFSYPKTANGIEPMVYSVYRSLDMGNPEDPPQRDYYLTLGTLHGARIGDTVDVYRRSSTYDVLSQRLYGDLAFPIAKLKIIHVEPHASIARLEKMLPSQTSAAITPRAVMIGDFVRKSE